jgi:hypothetical protein
LFFAARISAVASLPWPSKIATPLTFREPQDPNRVMRLSHVEREAFSFPG